MLNKSHTRAVRLIVTNFNIGNFSRNRCNPFPAETHDRRTRERERERRPGDRPAAAGGPCARPSVNHRQFRRSVGDRESVVWSDGLSVDQSVDRSAGRSVGRSSGRSVRLNICQAICRCLVRPAVCPFSALVTDKGTHFSLSSVLRVHLPYLRAYARW